MKNVLVTGAAGFIGSHFVMELLQHNIHVKVYSYDKLTYASDLNHLASVKNNPRHTFIQGDINDPVKVSQALRQHSIDTIVHFAAESHVDNSIHTPALFFETNVMGTVNLLQEAKQYWLEELKLSSKECHFHHVSTDEVYGSLSLTDLAFTESTPYAPNSPYSASKAASDHAVRAYGKTYGLPITISNCSNNYGPHQHAEKLIPTVIQRCLQQKAIPVYGNGQNCRDWLYVKDHCNAILAIVEKGQCGEVYNIGGGYEVDNLTLIKTLCQLMDERFPKHQPHENLITFVEDRKGHDFRYAINNEKIYNTLGWKPLTDPLMGLAKTLDYYVALFQEERKPVLC